MERLPLELGGLAIIAGMFSLVLQWMLGRFTKALDSISEAVRVQAAMVAFLSKELLVHDKTVTGINPSAGGNDREREENASAKYNQLLAEIEEVRKLILRENR